MDTPRYLTIYELTNAEVMASEQWVDDSETPSAGAVLPLRTDVSTNLSQFSKFVPRDEARREMTSRTIG